MAAITRHSLDAMAFLPDSIRVALLRRMREIAGIALIGLALAATVALASWSVKDPSLTHATAAKVRNLLGVPGAAAADLLTQLMGISAIALVLPMAAWGWRLLVHHPFHRERWRALLWLAGALAAAGFAACLPVSHAWPLPTGLGGVIGDALLRIPASIAGAPLSGLTRVAIALILGAGAVAALAVAMGIGLHGEAAVDDEGEQAGDDDPGERSSVSLGWLYHEFFSLRTRLLRPSTWAWWRRFARPQIAGAPVHEESEPDGDEEQDLDDEGESESESEAVDAPESRRTRRRAKSPRPKRSRGGFELPSTALLTAPKSSDRATLSVDTIQANATALESVLSDFGVRGEIINAHPGPVVTLYELEPAPGIKSSRVIGLSDDIARSMSALSARVAVVAGRNVIGIELPNPKREKVYLREQLESAEFAAASARLPLCLGKTIGGDPVIVDLARMPHLLIAGTTGSGKSVAINTMILSLVYRLRPEECRLIMVDPKMLELSVYDGIPHLLTPVVTDPKKAVVALKWAVREMEERYKKMSKLGVRNIDGYNARLADAAARGDTLTRTVQTGYDRESGQAIYENETLELEPLPYVVVIVDEMADLMMVAGKDIEGAIQRLAQMARAAGLHVILATQRPSVDVITGTIKANFPTRISFQVTSKI
ncbi:MAG: DNA translocase FtsK 4TM domain-containing protein, partial [Xanthobacteraceae bacterium]